MPSRACVLLNPNAGTASRVSEVRAALEASSDFALHVLSAPGEAAQCARALAAQGCELVVAAGGDGTVSEVADALASVRSAARLGILPLGTGNDLARSLAIPMDPQQALQVLAEGRDRAIDLVAVEPDDAPRTFAVNVAAGGFSGQVDEVLDESLKARWGPLAYVFGAVKVLPDLTGYETTLAFDDGPAERVHALNVVVANGRTCGGGKRVAPTADLEDGLLDVVVVRFDASPLELAGVAARLVAGNYLNSEAVYHRRARAVRISARPPMWFNVDGELVSKAAVTFRVVPRALRVIVGPDYYLPPTGNG